MPTIPHLSRVVILAAAVSALGLLLAWLDWPVASLGLEFSALTIAAILTSLPPLQRPGREWPALRLAFVIDFTALLIFGPIPAMVVAACGLVARELSNPQPSRPWQVVVTAITAAASLQAAALSYVAFGGAFGLFVWPWQAVPVAAAVVSYCLVTSASLDLLVPLVGKRLTMDALRRRPKRLLQACPVHIVGASAAAALVELIVPQRWEVLAISAVPLYLAYRLYSDYEDRVELERRRGEAMETLQDGVCTLDHAGRVTLWSDALERILECPRGRAIGRPLSVAVPGLASTELPRAAEQVEALRAPRSLTRVGLRRAQGVKVLHVTLTPVSDGVTLVWQDITEHARALETLQRHGERLELAAEAANDGLWELDLSTQQFFVTARWRAMLGLEPRAGVTTPEEWFDRVHKDDIGALKEALEAHLSGKTHPFQHEHRIRLEDGTHRYFQCRGVAVRLGSGRPTRIAGSLTDTTDLAITQEQLRNVVFRDPLTGLSNRAVFVEGLGRRLEESRQRRHADRFALLLLDLDRFKVVNDSLGHLVGDELLIAASRRLESCLRQGDVLARIGGDEFAILLNGLQSEQQANVIAFRVQEALSKPFSIAGREVFTSASIGIAFGLPQYNNPDEMMHDADTAMYQAKASGKARHEVFDADMETRARDRLGLENDLRKAISANEIVTHYQPIVSLASGMCVGFESLVRWTRDGKAVSPSTFIPIAEELGLIEQLGTRVLEDACRTFAAWQRTFPDAGLDCITVNVSSRQLMQQNFVSVVDRAVRQAGLVPSALRIEITETALMMSPDEAAKVLSQLRDLGVKIYLDDFGTGYSSLSHLHKLPVDALKIDRSFVRSLLLPNRPAIVESILALARTLHTSVVAEGIESDVQARELERLGCTHAQGYLFSKPISTESVEKILMARRPLGPKSGSSLPGVAVC